MEEQKLDEEECSTSLREDMTKEEEEEEAEFDGKYGVLERCCGIGRVWIFLVMGILILAFSAVLSGVYMNVRSVTLSMENLEVITSTLPLTASGLAGLLVLSLFWRRYKVLVYGATILCSCAAILCSLSAILTGTHVLQPLLSVSACVYNRLDRVCRCVTQFRREGLWLEKVPMGDSEYLTMKGILSCDDVRAVLPDLLFTMIGIYGVVSLFCLVAGIISLLVYRTEEWRKCLQQVEYEDQYAISPHQPHSDNHAEHHTMLPTKTASTNNATTLINIYTNPRTTGHDEDNSTNDDGNTTPSDLIYSSADVPMGYAEACGIRRCQSFSQPRQGTLQDSSPVSSTSSHAISLTGRNLNVGGAVKGQGKLKEHRKRGRRAVTLHGLDREQLLLILSLQMRYWQESDQSAKREGHNSMHNILKNDRSDCNQEYDDAFAVTDFSQENAEPSFAQLQRRAMTPTARQERLSSSQTTGDDLDYKPAKLNRSHTPQPHHFKSTNEYSPDLQTLPHHQIHHLSQQQQPLLQHQQQSQPMLRNNEAELPTLITYDLRNITKAAGPLVFENIHSARNSLSFCSPEDSFSSNNSSLICSFGGAGQPKLIPAVAEACPLPVVPAQASSNTMNQDKNKILGVNIQECENLKKQFIHHTSQASTSSQSDFENSMSDTRQLIPSEEKLTIVKKLTKNKGNKISNKEKKEYNVESEQTVCNRPSDLSRNDSTNSKCNTGADRWQTLMEGGTMQTQTLWENVQKKPMSDPHTPLDPHHSLTFNQQSQAAASQAECYDTSQITKSTPELPKVICSPQIPQTPKLINSNAAMDNFLETTVVPSQLSHTVPVLLNPNEKLQHQNLNTTHRISYNANLQNVFVPIGNSPSDNLEDIDSMYFHGKQQPKFLTSNQTTGNMRNIPAPPKPPRINGSYMARFDQPSNLVQTGFDSLDQQLRHTGYTNTFDRKMMDRKKLSNPMNNNENFSKSLNSSSQPWKNYKGLSMTTNKQVNGSFSDAESRNVSDRSAQNGIHFQFENGEMYTHPRRKSTSSTGVATSTSDYNPLQVYQTGHKYSVNPRQINLNKQRQSLHRSVSVLYPHKSSAFYSPDHSQNSGSSFSHERIPVYGRCDTDLDNLPAPQRQKQDCRSQFSPYSVHQSLDSVARFPSTRSGSTSSSEPHNTSYTSSEMSVIPFVDLQGGPPHVRGEGHSGSLRPVRFSNQQPGYPVDHRFYSQQHHYNLQQQQHEYNLQQQQHEYNLQQQHEYNLQQQHEYNLQQQHEYNLQQQHEYNLQQQHEYNLKQQQHVGSDVLGKEQLYGKNKVQIPGRRQPQTNIRRCQSMEEKNRTQPLLHINRRRNLPYQQDNAGVFYRNVRALHAEQNIRNGENKILNARVSSSNAEDNLISNSCDRTTLQNVHPVIQGYLNAEGQNRSILTDPTLLFKKIPANKIAGYVGVAKMVDCSDSDDYAETVI